MMASRLGIVPQKLLQRFAVVPYSGEQEPPLQLAANEIDVRLKIGTSRRRVLWATFRLHPSVMMSQYGKGFGNKHICL